MAEPLEVLTDFRSIDKIVLVEIKSNEVIFVLNNGFF